MTDKWPTALREIVERASAETRQLRHGYIGSEPLLLALAGAGGTRAAQRLESAGARYVDIRRLIVGIIGVGAGEISDGQVLPYTPHAAAAVRRVLEQAARGDPGAIGSEHVLRATLRRRESVAGRVIAGCGVDARVLADQLRRPLPDDN